MPLPGVDGRLRMYFECCPGPSTAAATIRSAVSDDGGLTWRVEAGARFSKGGGCCAARVVFLDDGRCRLYCGARGEGIVSAVSTDGGLTFRREPGLRVAPGPGHDAVTAFAPEVLRIDDGTYRMYYAGYGAPECAHVLCATSEDGLAWHKQATPAVAPGGRWDGAKCSEMCVVGLGVGGGPPFRLYYEACDGTAPDRRGVWRILTATAT